MSKNILSLVDLDKSFGERIILDKVTFGLDQGTRIGLIGANGAGKSTLLKILIGTEEADDGKAVLRGGTSLFYLDQDPIFSAGATARDVLQAPFNDVRKALDAYEVAVGAMDPAAEALLDQIEKADGWDWEHRMERAAAEAGVDDLERVVDVMSGGQRKRVALALMLLAAADLVLLDEPTNHLDSDTIEWLEGWLRATETTVILVTHDRYFLDQVVDQITELRDGKLRSYVGDYTDYLEARAIEEEHRDRVRHRRLNILKEELEWARRSPKARTTKQKARLGRIEGSKAEQHKLKRERTMEGFTFGDTPRLGKTILELVSVSKSFDGVPTLLDGFSLIVRKGERLGIIGSNGCGKTTLLRMCSGELDADKGTIIIGKNTKVSVFDQQRTILDLSLTVRETLVPDGGDSVFPGGQRVHVISWLERFAFKTVEHGRKVGTLSGGERNRLAIARFLLEDANVLLLDEPTNDLDLMTLNLLEAALLEFSGCVLVVTHDRYFLDKIATGIVAFERHANGRTGRVTVIQGDYTHYRRTRLLQLEDEKKVAAAAREAGRKLAAAGPAPKRQKTLTWGEQKELAGMEASIEAGDSEIERLERELADPAIWTDNHGRALELTELVDAAKLASATRYERWEELTAKQEGRA
ncbi:MAG: ATP-binding cassette subfamily F protein uup [Myxococcota bacterium]